MYDRKQTTGIYVSNNCIHDLAVSLSVRWALTQLTIYRHIIIIIVYLFIFQVCNRSDLVTPNFLEYFMKFWRCPAFSEYTLPPPIDNDDAIDSSAAMDSSINASSIATETTKKSSYIFEQIVSNCYLFQLTMCPPDAFGALERLLVQLIRNNYLTITALNVQCVALLRDEWPTVIDFFFAQPIESFKLVLCFCLTGNFA